MKQWLHFLKQDGRASMIDRNKIESIDETNNERVFELWMDSGMCCRVQWDSGLKSLTEYVSGD